MGALAGKLIITFATLAVLWLCLFSYRLWSFGNTDHAVKSDCAIVLGAAVHGAEPSAVFEQRIRHGIALYNDGVVKNLLFTGGLGRGATLAESTVARDYALRAGLPASAIQLETTSRTTRENLIEAKAVMAREGWVSAVIVSDPLHLRRASIIADNIGIQAVTSPTPTSQYRSFGARLKFLLRELYFCHQYLVFGF